MIFVSHTQSARHNQKQSRKEATAYVFRAHYEAEAVLCFGWFGAEWELASTPGGRGST